MISSGAVPAAGMAASRGEKKVEMPNNSPQTTVLRPVRAPALMPAADSGEMRMGGPLRYPLSMVSSPHTMNSMPPRGMAPLGRVRPARSDSDRPMPLRARMYRTNRLKTSRTTLTLTSPAVA